MIKNLTMDRSPALNLNKNGLIKLGLAALLFVLAVGAWNASTYLQLRSSQEKTVQDTKASLASISLATDCDLSNLKNFSRFILQRDALGDKDQYFDRNKLLACFPNQDDASQWSDWLSKFVQRMDELHFQWTYSFIGEFLAQIFP